MKSFYVACMVLGTIYGGFQMLACRGLTRQIEAAEAEAVRLATQAATQLKREQETAAVQAAAAADEIAALKQSAAEVTGDLRQQLEGAKAELANVTGQLSQALSRLGRIDSAVNGD